MIIMVVVMVVVVMMMIMMILMMVIVVFIIPIANAINRWIKGQNLKEHLTCPLHFA